MGTEWIGITSGTGADPNPGLGKLVQLGVFPQYLGGRMGKPGRRRILSLLQCENPHMGRKRINIDRKKREKEKGGSGARKAG